MEVMGACGIPPEAVESARIFLRHCDGPVIKAGYISRYGQVAWEERKRQAEAFVEGRDYRLPDAVAEIMRSCEPTKGEFGLSYTTEMDIP